MRYLNFSEALDLMHSGRKMARKGWNGERMFVFFVEGSEFEVNRRPLNEIFKEGTKIKYNAHLDIRGADGTISVWTASQTDLLTEDWYEVSVLS